MARMDEIDRIIRERLMGTPSANLQALLGTQSYRGTVGKVNRLGSIGNVGSVGRLEYLAYLGSVNRVAAVGSLNVVTRVTGLGTLATISRVTGLGTLATVNKVTGLGSLSTVVKVTQVGSIGNLSRIDAAGSLRISRLEDAGTLQIRQMGRRYISGEGRGTTPRLGPGSIWTGSWQHIGSFQTKTLMVKMSGTAATGKGSVWVIGGMHGTGENDGTFSYYNNSIGKGSADTFSFTESMRYARARVRQHGGAGGEPGGTVQVRWGFQV